MGTTANALYAIDASTGPEKGSVRFRVKLPGNIRSSVAVTRTSLFVMSEVHQQSGMLEARSRLNGSVLWSATVPHRVGSAAPAVAASAVWTHNGSVPVVVVSDMAGGLTAFHAGTGGRIWATSSGKGQSLGTPTIDPVNGHVYVIAGPSGPSLFGFSLFNGSRLDAFTHAVSYASGLAAPAISPDHRYVLVGSDRISQFSAVSGELVREARLPAVPSSKSKIGASMAAIYSPDSFGKGSRFGLLGTTEFGVVFLWEGGSHSFVWTLSISGSNRSSELVRAASAPILGENCGGGSRSQPCALLPLGNGTLLRVVGSGSRPPSPTRPPGPNPPAHGPDRRGTVVVITSILAATIVAVLAGAGVYWWKRKQLREQQERLGEDGEDEEYDEDEPTHFRPPRGEPHAYREI